MLYPAELWGHCQGEKRMPARSVNTYDLADREVVRKLIKKALPPSGEIVYWDKKLAGFGLKAKGKARTWIIRARPRGEKKSFVRALGKVTPEHTAQKTGWAEYHASIRSEAEKLKTSALDGLHADDVAAAEKKAKRAAQKDEMSLLDVYDLWVERAVANKKVSTSKTYIPDGAAWVRVLNGRCRILPNNATPEEREEILRQEPQIRFSALADPDIQNIAIQTYNSMCREVSTTRANSFYRPLSAMVNWAKRRLRPPGSELIDPPNSWILDDRKASKTSGKFIAAEDIEKLYRYLDDHDDQLFADLARFRLWTGLRWGEARTIETVDTGRNNHIDLDSGVLTLREHKTDGTTSDRKIQLHKDVLDLLQQRASQSGSTWVFGRRTVRNGKPNIAKPPQSYSTIKRRFDKLRQDTGIDATAYTLRHTFGTHQARIKDLHDVAAAMGHRDIKTTMKYVHTDPARQEQNSGDAVANFARLAGRTKRPEPAEET